MANAAQETARQTRVLIEAGHYDGSYGDPAPSADFSQPMYWAVLQRGAGDSRREARVVRPPESDVSLHDKLVVELWDDEVADYR
jgi:hypothetical protein